MSSNPFIFHRFIGSLIVTMSAGLTILAQQNPIDKEQAFIESAGKQWWYTMLFLAVAMGASVPIIWIRRNKAKSKTNHDFENRFRESKAMTDYDVGVDAEKELEWYRNARMTTTAKSKNSEPTPVIPAGRVRRDNRMKLSELSGWRSGRDDIDLTSRAFQDKMKQIQFSQLPIHSFLKLTDARPFEKLRVSSDQDLLCAIEQAQEEFEEDESVRDLAVRILAAFKTANSVEALSQIALYDLSSNLRSKAVNILADFDHESVFETILLACADPTREVRAAAARGLFRLSFDRSESWKRLFSTKDEYRMRHAARAAIESGIALKSLDRLLHEDMKIAFESVAMVGLLIKSGEHELVFEAIQNHKDTRVRLALLHVIKVVKDERTIYQLEKLSRSIGMPAEVGEKVADTMNAIAGMVVV